MWAARAKVALIFIGGSSTPHTGVLVIKTSTRRSAATCESAGSTVFQSTGRCARNGGLQHAISASAPGHRGSARLATNAASVRRTSLRCPSAPDASREVTRTVGRRWPARPGMPFRDPRVMAVLAAIIGFTIALAGSTTPHWSARRLSPGVPVHDGRHLHDTPQRKERLIVTGPSPLPTHPAGPTCRGACSRRRFTGASSHGWPG
jgi:hypothetical protein